MLIKEIMNDGNPKYSYELRNVLLAGISSPIIICIIIFGFALLELYNYRHHSLPLPTDSELLFRMAWCCVSYFLAVGLVLFLKDTLQKHIPAWLIVPFLGSIIYSLTFVIFAYIKTIEEIKNYKEPTISFGGQLPRPILPTPEELIRSILIVAFMSFIVTTIASFISPYIYNALPKREEETFLHLE